ncbi:MAG TPA: DUF3783 domain-containing protein [Clostridiales bacterium]|nr:DUF3783 domain-containing protein [Clostridiales bacterium]
MFAYFLQALLQSFLKSWKEMGIETVVLKEMLTQNNIKWTPAVLYHELLEEVRWFNDNKAPKQEESN